MNFDLKIILEEMKASDLENTMIDEIMVDITITFLFQHYLFNSLHQYKLSREDLAPIL